MADTLPPPDPTLNLGYIEPEPLAGTDDQRFMLDLGSGDTPGSRADDGTVEPGWIGIDLYCGEKTDLVSDLMEPGKVWAVDLNVYPWPWAGDTVDAVWASHYVEHIPRQLPDGTFGWCRFVDELWRILKPGATATITHPNVKSVRAFQDPTHLDFIPSDRWGYATYDWRTVNGLNHPPYPTCNFDVQVSFGGIAPWINGRSDQVAQMMVMTQWESAGDIRVLLTKLDATAPQTVPLPM